MENKDFSTRKTAKDVAKFIGMENEYNDALLEQELKQAYDTIMGDEYEVIDLSEEDNCEDQKNMSGLTGSLLD
jgi:hypothetical protein